MVDSFTDYGMISEKNNREVEIQGTGSCIITIQLLRDRRQKLLQIFDKHGAHSIKIFGSVARGEATDQSDIDFLIDYDRDRTTPWFPGGLINDLETYLNWKVDITTVHGLSPLIAENVIKDAVDL